MTMVRLSRRRTTRRSTLPTSTTSNLPRSVPTRVPPLTSLPLTPSRLLDPTLRPALTDTL